MVQCLSRDRGGCGYEPYRRLEQDTCMLILAYYWFNPGKPVPTLMRRKESNQTNKKYMKRSFCLYVSNQTNYLFIFCLGAQWLSGSVLNLRPRGCGLEPHWHHCVVSLSKTY